MLSILVVEDELNSRYALDIFLRSRGFNVRAVGTANDALEVSRSFEPQLLICDWILDGDMDGVQLSEKMRSRFPNLEIFFMTGFPLDQLRKRLKGFTVQMIFSKPTSLYELKNAVDNLINNKDRAGY